MKTRSCIALPLLFATLFSPFAALAQVYPAKAVRVVVPWPTGGSNDITARIVIPKMSEILKEQFVIDNRGGASGTIGADMVARSAPDGYTIMVHSLTHITNAHLYKKLPYDTLNDFTGITALAGKLYALVVHPTFPVKSVKEFITLAKKRPGDITYASSGNATGTHLPMALLAMMNGIKITHVPYKGGGPQVFSLVAGETQAGFSTMSEIYGHVQAKRLRLLGIATTERLTQFPGVPTIGESVPGFQFHGWNGAFAPRKTPKPIIDKLNAAFKRVLEDPDIASKFESQALYAMHMTSDQFTERLKSDYDTYGKLMREIGVTLD